MRIYVLVIISFSPSLYGAEIIISLINLKQNGEDNKISNIFFI